VEKLKGKYSNYDILRDGYYIDFTLEELYDLNFKAKLIGFINDNSIRCIFNII